MMSSFLRPATRMATLGIVLISTSVGAHALTVGRCSVLVDGVYTPVLIVENDGQKSVHAIGADGLTRRTAFNVNAALEWAVQLYGVDERSATYDDSCHTAIEPPATEPMASPPPPSDEDDEGEGESELPPDSVLLNDAPTGNDSSTGGSDTL